MREGNEWRVHFIGKQCLERSVDDLRSCSKLPNKFSDVRQLRIVCES